MPFERLKIKLLFNNKCLVVVLFYAFLSAYRLCVYERRPIIFPFAICQYAFCCNFIESFAKQEQTHTHTHTEALAKMFFPCSHCVVANIRIHMKHKCHTFVFGCQVVLSDIV